MHRVLFPNGNRTKTQSKKTEIKVMDEFYLSRFVLVDTIKREHGVKERNSTKFYLIKIEGFLLFI